MGTGHVAASYQTVRVSSVLTPLDTRTRTSLACRYDWGPLGYYDAHDLPLFTPHFDQLAANGVRFTRAFVGAPVSMCRVPQANDNLALKHSPAVQYSTVVLVSVLTTSYPPPPSSSSSSSSSSFHTHSHTHAHTLTCSYARCVRHRGRVSHRDASMTRTPSPKISTTTLIRQVRNEHPSRTLSVSRVSARI
jgi:hypothetical protein